MKYILFLLLALTTATAAHAGCAFNFNDEEGWCDDGSSSYESSYDEAPPVDNSCSCTVNEDSTSSTQWVPNPSGDGGNYETVYTPGRSYQVPCPCQ